MMGVGFARGGHSSSAKNPFLRLEAMDKGLMHPGYIIRGRAHEIELGRTKEKNAGFKFVQLQPKSQAVSEPPSSSAGRETLQYVKEWEMSPLVTHRLPELYERPNSFLPERWLKGEQPSPWAYLPFGAGPHVCVGASLAALEIRLTLAMLLQRFTLPPPDGTRIDPSGAGDAIDEGGHANARVVQAARREPPRIEGNINELFEAPAGTEG